MSISASKKWYKLDSYTMKCRLYLNKTQKKMVEEIFHAIKVAYNDTLYCMWTNYDCTIEREENGVVTHFPRVSEAAKSKHLDEIRERYPIINKIPASALSGNNGIFANDMKKSLEKIHDNKVKAEKSSGKIMPVEAVDKPNYITKACPRTSYTYQECLSKISQKDNKNVLYMNLNKIGTVKIRGWNRDLRFDEEHKLDFLEFTKAFPKQRITVTIKKDKCGDYYICFKFGINKDKKGIYVYKQYDIPDQGEYGIVGIDVGKEMLATLSDGTKYENIRIKSQNKKRLSHYDKLLSRRRGWRNEKFRDDYKDDKSLVPSKRYYETQLKSNKLNRKVTRIRSDYYHKITTQIINKKWLLCIETLSVTDMLKDPRTEEEKDITSPKFIPKRRVRNTNFNTLDAAMSTFLGMIKYKSEFADRECIEVGIYFPSSKTCHVCGYVKYDLNLNDREWDCPICGTHHNRDYNASIVIRYEGRRIYLLRIKAA